MAVDVDVLFERYSATKVTIVSGALVPNQAVWLDQETYASLEAAAKAARDEPRHAGKVHQMILHLPGRMDQPLSREEMFAILAPRREYHAAVRTGLRLARDRVEPLSDQLLGVITELNNIGRMGSGLHYQRLRSACLSCFREAADILVRTLVARKGDRAVNRREELEAALEELWVPIAREFDSHDGTPLFSKPIAERAELDAELARVTRRILLDFDEGVFHMNDKGSGDIYIENIGQMAGHIGTNNSGAVRAEQTINEASVLTSLAAAIRTGVQVEADRERMIAAIEAMNTARGDKSALANAYAAFISTAADYMSLVSPFLPALAQLISAAR